MKIEIKKNISKYYLTITFGFLFFISLGTFLIKTYFDLLEKKSDSTKPLLLILFGIGTILIGFYTVFRYYKNTPKITVFEEKIQLNNKSFNLNEIKTIQLTGKMPFKYVITFPMEGIYIKLKSNEEIFLFDDMYSNLWELKDFINKVYFKNETYPNLSKTNQTISNSEFYKYYNSSQFLSYRGLMLWGLLIPISYGLIFIKQNLNFTGYIFFITFAVFWYYFNSWLMHHYGVSVKFLIIKNTNLPWKRNIYSLNDIKEIVIESEGKMPICLRVITNNFQTKLFPGATLSESTWKQLKTDLRNKKIIVRDECIDFE